MSHREICGELVVMRVDGDASWYSSPHSWFGPSVRVHVDDERLDLSTTFPTRFHPVATMGHGTKQPGFGNSPKPLKPRDKVDEETDKYLAWADPLKTDVLVPFINLKGNAFLDLWLQQMISAKGEAMDPPEESSEHWFLALAGNLLWAASCFVPGAGVVRGAATAAAAIYSVKSSKDGLWSDSWSGGANGGMSKMGKTMFATMAIGGAYVGSGGVARHWTPGSPGAPSGKSAVADALNDRRKTMGKELAANIASYASAFMLHKGFADAYRSNAAKSLEMVQMRLWQDLFPSIPYEGRKQIYNAGLTSINDALKDFNQQYKTWRNQIERWALNDANTRYGIHQTRYQERLQYYERSPVLGFKPKLSF